MLKKEIIIIVGRKSYCRHLSWKHFQTRPRTLIDELTFTDFVSLNTLTSINVASRISISSAPKSEGVFHGQKLLTVYPTLFHFIREKNKKCMFPVGTRGLCSTVTLWELERSKEFHAATFVKIANVFIKVFFFERYIFIFFAAFHFVKLQLVNQILVFVTFIFCCCVLPTAAFLGFWFIDVFFLFCWHDVVYINILTSISWYIQFITVKVLGICEYLPPKKSSGTLRLKDKYVCYYERTIFVESR